MVCEDATRLRTILGLEASPVGVKFIKDKMPENAKVLKKHRYCQGVMKARKGEEVLLPGDEISCPAAAHVFGFKELPKKLEEGRGLVGFGIVDKPDTGAKMFQGMKKLKRGFCNAIYLYPLDKVDEGPNVVIVEDLPERLMWIALAYLNLLGGERIRSSTAVLQAVCVDSTIIPFLESKLNMTYGCYGCREATDIKTEEAILGFPGKILPRIVEKLEYLKEKAIPRARAKKAFKSLERR
ncbi:DUF169 domain-containing protein [Methanothermobacter tenebrarum]|uniref:DUF169 domain-containing protein n=1 Tax=Methanothermobacter tenebrarum TaxID=680118 RepID=A0A328P968_9EURY|nr:DUF169 domain-containing protein [Methanothermobacter tenebrarum]MBC7100758.1 DUF169 domain-containing protein [Methanobacteriales archaeon]MBC7118463.1 DUF169 domain-containing protein [Methanobacteriaceae archaeon]NPV63899.1 DUF169 domain-containing protein [Methanobacteriaceae archaeon]RAO79078.1 hypothetical protein DPC56_03910 [Methanothermobacter tenebrarum]